MSAPTPRRIAVLLAFAVIVAPHAAARAQAAVEPAKDSLTELAENRPSPTVLIAPLLTAGWSQTLGTPDAWRRTWSGYGSRVGDLYGFIVVRTTVRHLVDRAVPWVDDRSPCLSKPVSWGREVVARTGCAIVRTSTMRTTAGSLRPNLPFFAGVTAGTVASLSWRPERQSAVSSRAFVAQRLAISYGATVLVRLAKDWRTDAKTRP